MKSRTTLTLVFATACVHAFTNYPEYKYRIGYEAETVEQYDPTTGDLITFEGDTGEEIAVLADYEYGYANLFGGHSCVSVYPGANSLSLEDIPEELERLVGADHEAGMNRLFGWVMYPNSNACNLDLRPEDPEGDRVALSLAQAKYGYTQNEDMPEFSGFPQVVGENGRVQPPSFRLYVNPELWIPPPGVQSFIGPDLPFSAVGLNAAVPSEHIPTGEIDWPYSGGTELDPTDPIVRQYAPLGGTIYQPDERIDRIVAPQKRLRPGDLGFTGNPDDYVPYPGFYSLVDPRIPMEVSRPINMLARLGDDLDSGIITLAELELVEPEVDAFAEAFMGPPLPTDPEAENLVPTRYDWPSLALLSYLNNLRSQGFAFPGDTQNPKDFYTPGGNTLSEAISIAQSLNAGLQAWLEDQPADVLGDWGAETSPQVQAEKWLYSLEEGIWEDFEGFTGSANSIASRPDISSEIDAGANENARRVEPDVNPSVNNPVNMGANNIQQSVMFQPEPVDVQFGFDELALDEQPVDEAALRQNDLDISFVQERIAEVDNQNPVANPRNIFSNLGSWIQSQELADESAVRRENTGAIRHLLNDVVAQAEERQGVPAEDIRNDLIQEPQSEVIYGPSVQQNAVIEQIDESEIQSQGAQSLANPNMESMDLGNFDQLSQSQQLALGNAVQAGDLTSVINELYGGREPRWLGKVRQGGRKRSPGPG
ncbi:hypothetical protein TWF481_007653 [Arthrobotrys musiformis]|uniref:Uncharacterized protein n=1 Tax=Arthrobotrys musiformis TaxID=47236 RepID=A0AAV9WE20_9PEZI